MFFNETWNIFINMDQKETPNSKELTKPLETPKTNGANIQGSRKVLTLPRVIIFQDISGLYFILIAFNFGFRSPLQLLQVELDIIFIHKSGKKINRL
jgi:hypothetical protein